VTGLALLLAAAIPGLFVDADPSPALEAAGFECVAIPAARAAAWQGKCAKVFDNEKATRLPAPGVRYRMNEARASSAPWVDTNGARFARGIAGAALIAGKDWKPLAEMRRFLSALPAADLPVLANIGFLDDGTPAATENMKLMLRRNLLFQVVRKENPALDCNVKSKPGDPSAFAYEVRKKVSDEKRLLRLYGSEVVVARLSGDASRRRVALLNYGNRPVEGLRVRVLGAFPKVTVHAFNDQVEATDVVVEDGATEFSLPRVPVYTVVDLAR